MAWQTLGDAVNVESLASFVAGGLVTGIYQTHVATSPAKSLLEDCKKELEDVAWRVEKLTPRQREEIFVLTRQGKCKSLEEIEQRYLRLLDHNDELSDLYEGSSVVQRHYYNSELMVDIRILRQQLVALQKDIRNTTTSRNKEAQRLAQVQREQVEHQSPSPSASPTVEPRPQSTNAQSSTVRPEGYPLDAVYPPSAHLAVRHGALLELPPGIV